jgi:hypothetical protein
VQEVRETATSNCRISGVPNPEVRLFSDLSCVSKMWTRRRDFACPRRSFDLGVAVDRGLQLRDPGGWGNEALLVPGREDQ